MSDKSLFSEYLKSTLAKVPPGAASRQVVDTALMEHDGVLRAIANSKANVMQKEQRMDAARTSLIATLYTLVEAEQPEQPPAEEPTARVAGDTPSPLDRLIEERSQRD